jgi:hypothetical protein
MRIPPFPAFLAGETTPQSRGDQREPDGSYSRIRSPLIERQTSRQYPCAWIDRYAPTVSRMRLDGTDRQFVPPSVERYVSYSLRLCDI